MHWLDSLYAFIVDIPVEAWIIAGCLAVFSAAARWWVRRKRDKSKTPSRKDPAGIEAAAAAEEAETPRADAPTVPGDAAPPDVAQPTGAPTPPPPVAPKPVKPSLAERLQMGLAKTRAILSTDLEKLLAGNRRLDDELLEELEELLITADIGVQTTMNIVERMSQRASEMHDTEAIKETLRQEILALMPPSSAAVPSTRPKPEVVMVVGVNGVGKTTTIGKIAARHTAAGRRVILGAADTFRAAAVEQLSIWAERAGADIVKHREGADPAAVAYDSVEAAVAREADLVLIDTAGRLHTKVNLMEELKKIRRAVAKKLPDAPHEILLVIDATTGQNALKQAEIFHEALGLTGIALTKLDGTARGGIVVGICSTMDIPLRYVGVGEGVEDLQPFDPKSFVAALI